MIYHIIIYHIYIFFGFVLLLMYVLSTVGFMDHNSSISDVYLIFILDILLPSFNGI